MLDPFVFGEEIESCTEFSRMLELSTQVQYVKGVGPRIAEVLAAATGKAGEEAPDPLSRPIAVGWFGRRRCG